MQPNAYVHHLQPIIIQHLLDRYPLGSAIHRAVEFGIDLTLNLENLKLTPTERILKAQRVLNFVVAIRGTAQKAIPKNLRVP